MDISNKKKRAIRNILITGGAGFVGSNLAFNLAKENPNFKILVLDNLKRRGSELNLPEFHKQPNISFIHADIRNEEDLDFQERIDLIIECSAEPSVLAGSENPKYLINTNLMGTLNCLEIARRHNSSFIFLSTSRIYPIDLLTKIKYSQKKTRFEADKNQSMSGITSLGISEDFPLGSYRSLYGATKLSSEIMINEYAQTFNLKTVINRCGLIAGPRQMGKIDQGVVTLWVVRHMWNGELSYIGFGGTGKQVRDILHVDDLFTAIKWQIANIDKITSQTFNLGGGIKNSLSLVELTELTQKIVGKKINIKSVPENRNNDIPIYVTDYKKFTDISGWKAQKSPAQTIRDIYDWAKNNEDKLRRILG